MRETGSFMLKEIREKFNAPFYLGIKMYIFIIVHIMGMELWKFTFVQSFDLHFNFKSFEATKRF